MKPYFVYLNSESHSMSSTTIQTTWLSINRKYIDTLIHSTNNTPTYAIAAYHYWCCDSNPAHVDGVLDTTLCDKFVGGFARFPPQIKLTTTKKRNIVESGVKNHN